MMWIIFFTLLLAFVSLFHKKLIVLLSMEGGMLVTIILSQLFLSSNSVSYFVLIILSVFMVLDSVFGISLLISASRSSNLSSKIFS